MLNNILIGLGLVSTITGAVGSFVSDNIQDKKKQSLVNLVDILLMSLGIIIAAIGLNNKLTLEDEEEVVEEVTEEE